MPLKGGLGCEGHLAHGAHERGAGKSQISGYFCRIKVSVLCSIGYALIAKDKGHLAPTKALLFTPIETGDLPALGWQD